MFAGRLLDVNTVNFFLPRSCAPLGIPSFHCVPLCLTQATRRILRVLAPQVGGTDPPTLLRLGLGVLLQTIVGNMQQRIAGT